MVSYRPRSTRTQVFQSSQSHRPFTLPFFPRTMANLGPPSRGSHLTLMGSSAPAERQGAWR